MNNQEIIDNAPKGEDDYFVDITGDYFDEYGNHLTLKGLWSCSDQPPVAPRSLADIKRIVELEKDSNWISVSDSLPDPSFDFVLAFADGAMSTIGYTLSNGFYEVHPIKTQLLIECITHWMPLPPPPKSVNSD
jgi:hypothetical protein